MVHLVACSASAGALASWLTPPLDMTKLRIQVQRGNVSAPRSSEKVHREKARVSFVSRNVGLCMVYISI